MKSLIALILSCLSVSAAALYPVITDNPNRQFSGGSTNLALLSGTNVFTGTNTLNINTIIGTNQVANLFSYGGRSRILWQTNNAIFTLIAGQTNAMSAITVPLLSSNSVVMARYTMTKKSENPVTSLTWELREDDGSGAIIWGVLNGGATVTAQLPTVLQQAIMLTSWQEAYGPGKTYQNNTTQTNYYSTRGWETNRTLHLSIIGGGTSSNTFYVPIFQLIEVY